MNTRDAQLKKTNSGDARVEISVSSYDRFNSLVIAAILMFGFAVTVMMVLYFFSGEPVSQKVICPDPIIIVCPFPQDDQVNDEDPGPTDVPLEDKYEFELALEVVTDATSSVLGVNSRFAVAARENSRGRDGNGRGDGVLPGPTPPRPAIPEYKRWQIRYECDDLKTYAQQLDFLKVKLAAVNLNSNEITLITGVAGQPEVVSSSRREQSSTVRFEHQQRRLRRWDNAFAERVGVTLDDCVMVQFYPEIALQMIRDVEAAYLQDAGRDVSEVSRTFVVIETDGNGFRFRVTDMVFRN